MNNYRIVDMHSHILAGVDHGSKSLETSLEMLIQAKKAGVDAIVATPHFYYHQNKIDAFVKARDAALTALNSAMKKRGIDDIEIYPAAEVALEASLFDLDSLDKLRIGNTDFILIEMPFCIWSSWVFDAVYEIENKYGLKPIIAHIERYSKSCIQRIVDMGFPAQINATLLTSRSGRKEAKMLYDSGCISFIGSDAHDVEQRNYSHFTTAMKKGDGEMLEWFSECSEMVLKKNTLICV